MVVVALNSWVRSSNFHCYIKSLSRQWDLNKQKKFFLIAVFFSDNMLNFLYNLDNLYNVLYLVSFSLIVSSLIIGSIIKLAGRAGKEALDIVAKIVVLLQLV